MKVLVAGAGYVGTAVISQLRELGHEAVGLRRSASDDPKFVSGDACTGRGLETLPSDFEQIVVALSPDTRSDEAYRRAYPDTVRTLRQIFPEARLLLVSSTTVYGQVGGDEISDESQTTGDSFSATRILEAERLVLDGDPGGVVVRASGIYGPGRVATISKLAHVELTQDDRELWTNRVHRDDLAHILVHLIENPDKAGVYLATDPTPSTLGQIRDFVRSHRNHKRLKAPVSSRRTRSRKSRKMYPKRLLEEGFRFKYESFADGYGPILDALKSPEES